MGESVANSAVEVGREARRLPQRRATAVPRNRHAALAFMASPLPQCAPPRQRVPQTQRLSARQRRRSPESSPGAESDRRPHFRLSVSCILPTSRASSIGRRQVRIGLMTVPRDLPCARRPLRRRPHHLLHLSHQVSTGRPCSHPVPHLSTP